MSSGDNGLLVSSVPMQQQRGSCDCGMFTIATAFHIAAGIKIEDVVFDQTMMRSHLLQCFKKKVLSPFPSLRKQQVARNKLLNIVIPVYCHCGRPDSLDEMIQCDACDAWFHFECVRIQIAPDDWSCSNYIDQTQLYTSYCYLTLYYIKLIHICCSFFHKYMAIGLMNFSLNKLFPFFWGGGGGGGYKKY